MSHERNPIRKTPIDAVASPRSRLFQSAERTASSDSAIA